MWLSLNHPVIYPHSSTSNNKTSFKRKFESSWYYYYTHPPTHTTARPSDSIFRFSFLTRLSDSSSCLFFSFIHSFIFFFFSFSFSSFSSLYVLYSLSPLIRISSSPSSPSNKQHYQSILFIFSLSSLLSSSSLISRYIRPLCSSRKQQRHRKLFLSPSTHPLTANVLYAQRLV